MRIQRQTQQRLAQVPTTRERIVTESCHQYSRFVFETKSIAACSFRILLSMILSQSAQAVKISILHLLNSHQQLQACTIQHSKHNSFNLCLYPDLHLDRKFGTAHRRLGHLFWLAFASLQKPVSQFKFQTVCRWHL